MKKEGNLSYLFVFLVAFCLIFPPTIVEASSGQAKNKPVVVGNEYIEYAVDNNDKRGRFTIGTVKGNPNIEADDHKELLYGHPRPSTSFTMIRIDKTDYYFQAPQLRVEGTTCWAEVKVENEIILKQELRIVGNSNTGLKDTVQIKYIVENRDTVSHAVGLKMVLDTKLGEKDGAPFRVPGYGNITKELELTGNAIPAYWQSFDSLTEPKVFSTGTFYQNISERPDKVQFARWFLGLGRGTWEYQVNPNQSLLFDSALAICWNQASIRPGGKREFVTYYGLGAFTKQDLRPPLLVSVSAPQALSLSAEGNSYLANPFSISVYISNSSEAPALTTKAELILPEELELISEKAEVIVGNLGQGQEKMLSWQVQAKDCAQAKDVEYQIKVRADNAECKVLDLKLSLPAIIKALNKELSSEMGIEYEQTTTLADNAVKPDINEISFESSRDEDNDYFTVKITGYKCDPGASPFFFWKADEAVFVNASPDFKEVEVIAAKGKAVTVHAYIGDNLGRVGVFEILLQH